VYPLEPGLLGAELYGKRFRAGGLGLVVPDFRVRGLLSGVGLGLAVSRSCPDTSGGASAWARPPSATVASSCPRVTAR
jgi:hypothetical protein